MRNNKMNGSRNNPYIQQNNQGDFLANQGSKNMQGQGMNSIQQDQSGINPYYTQNAVAQNGNISQASAMDSLLNSFDTQNFLKGALIGAVGAYLLTNENAQKTIFKTVAKAGDMFGAGMEEMKERMEDAKAELEAQREAKA